MASMEDWAAGLLRASVLVSELKQETLEKAAKIVETEAKDVIGTYRDGYGWPQLAQSTQDERERLLGKEHRNEPLLRTGEMRDSISHYVDGDAAYVGSPSKIALWQELGTKSIPPRSFLGGAARAKEGEIHDLGAEASHTAIAKALGL